MNNLNKLAKEIYEGNKLRGFDVAKENIGQTLMLVVSELAEALEADRKNHHAVLHLFEKDLEQMNQYDERKPFRKTAFAMTIKDTFEDEIADAFIRLFDLAGGLGIDIEKHIDLKLRYNATREHRHGKAY